MNKKLLIVLMMIVLSLTACQSKAPNGVSKEFYNDMSKLITNMEKQLNSNKSDSDIAKLINPYKNEMLNNYLDNTTLNPYEQEIFDSVFMINMSTYNLLQGDEWEIDNIRQFSEQFTDLTNIELNILKLVK